MAASDVDQYTNPSPITGGTIFIEILRVTNQLITDKVISLTAKWLKENFALVMIGQRIEDLNNLNCPDVERLDIVNHSRTLVFPDKNTYSLEGNSLQFYVYTLHSDIDDDDDVLLVDGHDRLYRTTDLPHRCLDDKWDSLLFEEPTREITLRTLIKAIAQNGALAISNQLQDWQNTVIFHGPQGKQCQGSGKTSLAQALAQKLSIRLSDRFNKAKLLNVNSHALFSRYFGESAKYVGKLFEDILKISSEETQLVVVIFDEVETLALSRGHGNHLGEVADSMRSTNQLLTGLDRLRGRPNVIFIATTNMLASMDKAFLDRCCIKKEIRNPSSHVSYEIVRRAINSRINQGLVYCSSLVPDGIDIGSDEESSDDRQVTLHQSHMIGNSTAHFIPDLSPYDMLWSEKIATVPSELVRIVKQGRDISARKWRHLVNWAIFAHTVETPCDVRDLLLGLEKVLAEELRCMLNACTQKTNRESNGVPEMSTEDAEAVYRQMFPDHRSDLSQ